MALRIAEVEAARQRLAEHIGVEVGVVAAVVDEAAAEGRQPLRAVGMYEFGDGVGIEQRGGILATARAAVGDRHAPVAAAVQRLVHPAFDELRAFDVEIRRLAQQVMHEVGVVIHIVEDGIAVEQMREVIRALRVGAEGVDVFRQLFPEVGVEALDTRHDARLRQIHRLGVEGFQHFAGKVRGPRQRVFGRQQLAARHGGEGAGAGVGADGQLHVRSGPRNANQPDHRVVEHLGVVLEVPNHVAAATHPFRHGRAKENRQAVGGTVMPDIGHPPFAILQRLEIRLQHGDQVVEGMRRGWHERHLSEQIHH
ncbi:MAG: hypothetical protein BWY76_02058 [bacterium ADurb.Bin429]|nr:MAG: hypothetical protein BWY76_02058 [bacterium ADurb.Bin429]